jgi:hypothetical protein
MSLGLEISIGNAREKIHCIKLIAEYLQSKKPEIRKEGERIRKNLIDNLEKLEKDSRKQFPVVLIKNPNGDYSQLNFKSYIERLKNEENLGEIKKELGFQFCTPVYFQAY